MIWFASVLVLIWSLAGSDGGFVPDPGGVQWEWGLPTSGPGGVDTVWATNLSGNYLNDATDTLEVPVPDLTGLTDPVLVVHHWYEIQPGDLAWFEVDDGSGWRPLDPIYGYPGGIAGFDGSSGGWVDTSLDLRGLGPTPGVRLVFAADASLAAAGWYIGEVALHDGDVTPPQVTPVLVPVDTEDFDNPYPVQVQVVDDAAVTEVTLEATVNTAPLPPIPMVDLGGGLFEGSIPPQPHRTVVSWLVRAGDGTQSATYPEVGEASFVVELRPPTGFAPVPAAGREVGNQVDFAWTAPQTAHLLDGYWVNAVDLDGGGRTVLERTWVDPGATTATVLLQPDGPRTFDLVAEYAAYGQSEPTPPVTVDRPIPTLEDLIPAVGFQGDRIRVRIQGSNLYLDAGDFAVFDGRIVAEPLEVETVNDATVAIEIPSDTPTGPVGLLLVTQWGSYRFEDVFTVLSASEAPRVVEVLPASIRQGASAQVQIRASADFAGEVQVQLDDDLVLLADPVVEGAALGLELAARSDAAPGAHTVILDDGSRLWEAELIVEERLFTGQSGCGGCNPAPNAPGSAPWWLFLVALRRRS